MSAFPGLSLKARLLAGSLVWITLTLLVTGFVLVSLFRLHVERRFDAELATHLDQLLAVLQPGESGSVALARPLTDPRFDKPYSALYWQVEGPNGTLLRSRSLWDQTLALPRDSPADGEIHRHILPGPAGQHLVAVERKVSLPGRPEIIRPAIAGSLDVVTQATAEFVRTTVLTLGILASGLVLAVVVQAIGALRPLTRLQAALGDVRLGRAARLAGQFPSEVQPLVDDLNGLLAHNTAVLERARTEAGNLAHQLKTPLAIIANAAVELPGGEPARMVVEQARSMGRSIDYALARARAAASGKVLGTATSIAPQLERVAAAVRTLHADRGIRIEVACHALPYARIEPQDFDEILGNLLDNACKWARTRVVISAEEAEQTVVVVVEDDGPGLPQSERERVFKRGHRLDETAPGAGLGLSIVRDLAAVYDGRISLETAASGGLRAVLSLPVATAASAPAVRRGASEVAQPRS